MTRYHKITSQAIENMGGSIYLRERVSNPIASSLRQVLYIITILKKNKFYEERDLKEEFVNGQVSGYHCSNGPQYPAHKDLVLLIMPTGHNSLSSHRRNT
jgi:hypothetical protein